MLDSLSGHWATGQLGTPMPFSAQSIKAGIMEAKHPDQKIPIHAQPVRLAAAGDQGMDFFSEAIGLLV